MDLQDSAKKIRDYNRFDNPIGRYAPRYEVQFADADVPVGGFNVESIRNYGPGGFHPVAIGDVLDRGRRYKVFHKLGHGGFGTVWLCLDVREDKWRAVKILMARDCIDRSSKFSDVAFVEYFESMGIDRKQLQENNLTVPLDTFWIEKGPNGSHLCIVMPLMGPPISHFSGTYGHCRELLKDIAFQVTKTLIFLHSHGICHGDFRPDNILFQLAEGVDELSNKKLLGLFGPPIQHRVRQVNKEYTGAEHTTHVPKYLVETAHIDYGKGALATSISVGDFGLFYPFSQPRCGGGTGIPLPYAAPEAVFEFQDMLGPATDVWALACTIMHMQYGFPPVGEGRPLEDMLESLEIIMGPMPEPFRTRWREWNPKDQVHNILSVPVTYDPDDEMAARAERYEEKGTRQYLHWLMLMRQTLSISPRQARQIIHQDYSVNCGILPTYEPDFAYSYKDLFTHTLDAEDVQKMYDLLLAVLHWDPKKRATAAELIDFAWFGQRNIKFPESNDANKEKPPSAAKPSADSANAIADTVKGKDAEMEQPVGYDSGKKNGPEYVGVSPPEGEASQIETLQRQGDKPRSGTALDNSARKRKSQENNEESEIPDQLPRKRARSGSARGSASKSPRRTLSPKHRSPRNVLATRDRSTQTPPSLFPEQSRVESGNGERLTTNTPLDNQNTTTKATLARNSKPNGSAGEEASHASGAREFQTEKEQGERLRGNTQGSYHDVPWPSAKAKEGIRDGPSRGQNNLGEILDRNSSSNDNNNNNQSTNNGSSSLKRKSLDVDPEGDGFAGRESKRNMNRHSLRSLNMERLQSPNTRQTTPNISSTSAIHHDSPPLRPLNTVSQFGNAPTHSISESGGHHIRTPALAGRVDSDGWPAVARTPYGDVPKSVPQYPVSPALDLLTALPPRQEHFNYSSHNHEPSAFDSSSSSVPAKDVLASLGASSAWSKTTEDEKEVSSAGWNDNYRGAAASGTKSRSDIFASAKEGRTEDIQPPNDNFKHPDRRDRAHGYSRSRGESFGPPSKTIKPSTGIIHPSPAGRDLNAPTTVADDFCYTSVLSYEREQEENEYVQWQTKWTLAALGPKAAIPPLIDMMGAILLRVILPLLLGISVLPGPTVSLLVLVNISIFLNMRQDGIRDARS